MKYLLSLFIVFFFLEISAQQVENKAFDVLLKSMLSNDVPTVSVEELAKKKNVVMLDARERKEYNVSHLRNARWIGYDDFTMQRMSGIPKNSEIVIYCSIGVRSEKIGKRLKDAGYTNVKNLYGSIFEWVNQGNPVYTNGNKPTPKVHAYDRTWGIWLNKGEKVY